jgi:hypothetical protein
MITPAVLGRLRRTSLWPRLRAAHQRIVPPINRVIHRIVTWIGPQRLPTDLGLKHTYDYQVIWLDPRTIRRSLRVGEWAVPDPATPETRIARFRRWASLGGGWKHLQHHPSRNLHGRFIAGGDWDLKYQPFTIRETITDLFVEALPPSETLEYKKMMAWIDAGNFAWTRGCLTSQDVDRYFDDLIRLHELMKTDGYRTQLELGRSGADEIRICIDREGRPCVFGGGTHRLSIALLLQIDRVPVVLKRVHAQWVRRCLELYRGDNVHQAVAFGVDSLQAATVDERSVTHGEDPS